MRRLLDTELLIGVPKQVLDVSDEAIEEAANVLPVLDGSSLQTMRKRVAAAIDQAYKAGFKVGYNEGRHDEQSLCKE